MRKQNFKIAIRIVRSLYEPPKVTPGIVILLNELIPLFSRITIELQFPQSQGYCLKHDRHVNIIIVYDHHESPPTVNLIVIHDFCRVTN